MTRLKELPDESVDCIITSPPYYGVRDYGTAKWEGGNNPACKHTSYSDLAPVDLGRNTNIYLEYCKKCGAKRVDTQLGLELTPEEFLDKLVAIFVEIKRVLKKYGTCWVNMGDTYNGNKRGNTHGTLTGSVRVKHGQNDQEFVKKIASSVPNKSLLMIPERFAQKMVEHGWILRSKIIWHKPNAMPGSAKNRFTVDWEYVFMFAKNNEPLCWVNTKDARLVREQPPGTNGVEGVDWDWSERDAEDLDDEERPESWIKGEDIGKEPGTWWAKESYWEGHDYYFETQFEPQHEDSVKRAGSDVRFGGNKAEGYGPRTYSRRKWLPKNLQYKGPLSPHSIHVKRAQGSDQTTFSVFGRIKRCVWEFAELFLLELAPDGDRQEKGELWSISTKGVKEAHFATYPEELIETPIKAGCPEFVCKKCGMPRVRLFTEERINTRPGLDVGNGKSGTAADPNAGLHNSDLSAYRQQIIRKEVGLSDCGCGAGWRPGIVLDFFFGSGTTGIVALKLGRDFLGIELNVNYIKIAMNRLKPYLSQKRLF